MRGWREILRGAFAVVALGAALGGSGAVAAAPPALPASLWGRVTLSDGAPAPEGLVVEALVEGVGAGEGVTREYEGHTVYTLHVLADDPDTPAREGGRAGDTVGLILCGAVLEVEGVWQGGTNTRLDLTVPEGLVCEAAPTPTPIPTPTAEPTGLPSTTATSPASALSQESAPSPARAAPGATPGPGSEAQVVAAALPVAAEGEPAPSAEGQARSGGLDGALLAALVGTVAVGALVAGRLRGAHRG